MDLGNTGWHTDAHTNQSIQAFIWFWSRRFGNCDVATLKKNVNELSVTQRITCTSSDESPSSYMTDYWNDVLEATCWCSFSQFIVILGCARAKPGKDASWEGLLTGGQCGPQAVVKGAPSYLSVSVYCVGPPPLRQVCTAPTDSLPSDFWQGVARSTPICSRRYRIWVKYNN